MSDFSAMEQSFALPAATPERSVHEVPAPLSPAPARHDISADELSLHGLKSPREIAEVMHLRRQIRLPAQVLADPGFAVLEKKETGQGWWPPCAGAGSRWAH